MHILQAVLLYSLSAYQKIVSPLLPSSCRFFPFCSDYMKECIRRFGLIKGLYKGTMRLFRCHPGSRGGWDPVKEK